MVQAVDPRSLFGPRMTLEEWADLPEDVPGEIVDDRLVEEEMSGYAHEVIVAFLARILGMWADQVRAIVATSDARFAVANGRGRKPDLSVFFAGRRPPRRGLVRIAPDIAVEVVSSSPDDVRRDRVEKLAEYAEFGIRWYWIVDPDRRILQVHELIETGAYRVAVELDHGSCANVPGCAGLVLPLDELWSKVDELGE
jgi:Uma2 family endonuclease